MASRPRLIAVGKADGVYGLPAGTTQRLVDDGALRRVLFVDCGEPVSGVVTEDLLRLVVKARAAHLRRMRAAG